ARPILRRLRIGPKQTGVLPYCSARARRRPTGHHWRLMLGTRSVQAQPPSAFRLQPESSPFGSVRGIGQLLARTDLNSVQRSGRSWKPAVLTPLSTTYVSPRSFSLLFRTHVACTVPIQIALAA